MGAWRSHAVLRMQAYRGVPASACSCALLCAKECRGAVASATSTHSTAYVLRCCGNESVLRL